ncbi:non-ribosomal peptide synthase TIGR01720 domain protein [Lyngbya aestuarii BL J]|uniref:Non-ribosomal peptide synthase TIGR01720 domain protein n=1 Tax=Lyngbya aestuarii BL J TaxID=1348334 RepID=U7QC67_9CYAN|nr:non-ribosomal peptide synthetase [Lyngbya aestuarii]ERT05439.1 non-ribosomal peptide synthase TIGR01720 domain protein [Lyngbya aestuarii BL J]
MTNNNQRLDELTKRIANLSPEKRLLLEQQLKNRKQQFNSLTIPKRKTEDNLPLSFAQQRLWFIHQLDPETSAYNIPVAWHLNGHLNLAILVQTLNEVVRRHESLRTTFNSIENNQPQQTISSHFTLDIPIIDLQILSENHRDSEVKRLAKQEAKRPFNLNQYQLIRVTLLKISETQFILLLTLHHIIADGWSRGVLLKEFSAIYKAFSEQKPSPLPELNIQYVDFAIWQQQWLSGEELKTQLTYWKQQLKNLTTLNLPTDYPRPVTQSFRGKTQSLTLSKELTTALKALSRQQGVTLFMTLLAAFKILLHRYSNQDDIVIGSPIANRNRQETESLIGFFVNTLVLRTDLSGNPSFEDVLKRVREVTSGAYKHQDLPFSKLVEELQPERNLSHNPLFQVMFQFQNEAYQFQNSSSPELQLPNLQIGQFWIDPESTKFDITWHLIERESEILVVIEYSTDLFKQDTIARMLGHFQMLLSEIIANPQVLLSNLSILTLTEQHQLLTEWNKTQANYINTCVHHLFENQVQQEPDAVAIRFNYDENFKNETIITYKKLNIKANKLAHYLQKKGVKPEVLVGICIPRSPELLIAILAVLKAGGAYVPLDLNYPSERLGFMLSDAQVAMVLTTEKLNSEIVKHIPSTPILNIKENWNIIDCEIDSNPTNSGTIHNLAYVIYTSGSTGKPKGTLLTHQGLINYLNWAIQEYDFVNGEGSPLHSSIGFDATITSLFCPLLVGKTIFILSENQEIEALSAALSSEAQFSLVKVTPAHLGILSQLLSQQSKLSQINSLIIGGDALLAENLSFWRKNTPKTRLINEYGPTETVVGCCVYEVPTQASLSGAVSIGRPIANTQIYILDRYLQPVPIGVPGELYIGGLGVARGYLNRPDLTAEKFIPNPFNRYKTQDRLYKTGDLARYLTDGNIEYLGRLDHQVKIRGFRIELGEIEAVLTQHPEVQEARVTVQENSANQRLVAYTILHSEIQDYSLEIQNKLHHFLKNKLPHYMIPNAFIILSAFPLTPNGKVDLKALPKVEEVIKTSSSVAPSTPNEKILTEIWRDVLGKENIGIYDNFFELGGDSIQSISIISKATQAGLKLTPRQIFQYQTIAELAAIATSNKPLKTEQGLATGSVALTPIQHWFFEQKLLHLHHYNQSVVLEVSPDINFQDLEQSIQQLLVQHDSLRLRFKQDNTDYKQFYSSPEETIPASYIDLSELTENQKIEAYKTASERLQKSLNISYKLVKAALFKLGNNQLDRLLFIIHHLAVDGVSWRIILEDFALAYKQLSHQEKIKLPAKTSSYQDWSTGLISYSESGKVTSELNYWLAQSQKSINSIPVDFPVENSANTVGSTAKVCVSLDINETQLVLEEIPKILKTQINDILLTAIVQSFAQWTGLRSLLIDLEGHGREEQLFENINISRTVGWFSAIFPVVLELGTIHNTGEALKCIKEQLNRIPNHGMNYGIMRYLSPDKTVRSQLKAAPQASVIFNYLGQINPVKSEFFTLDISESSQFNRSPEQIRRYLLEINGFVSQNKLQLNWIYSQNIHKRETIEYWANHFITAIKAIITYASTPEAEAYTPSDFSSARINQKQLDKLLTKLKKKN